MAKFGRGLICAPTVPERLQQLGIERMVLNNRESHRTDFQISVDAANGITTGISAADRAKTIKTLANPTSIPKDLVQPGHIFPLRAKAGGVLQRAGHTEAAVDLAQAGGSRGRHRALGGSQARLPGSVRERDTCGRSGEDGPDGDAPTAQRQHDAEGRAALRRPVQAPVLHRAALPSA